MTKRLTVTDEVSVGAWAEAAVVREAAQDRLRVLLAQAEIARLLGASVGQAYELAGTTERLTSILSAWRNGIRSTELDAIAIYPPGAHMRPRRRGKR
jgi:hypothetical protein